MDNNNRNASFPIVAIGASAGGLNSLQCFIATLPKKFGFAVVFMQHLSAKHKSLLPGLLRNRRPGLDINEISDGTQLLPGKIYLCPPGKEIRIVDSTFQVSAPSEEHFHLPIDKFFSSIAEEAGERAIGVIFSGAGTDGARGVQAIRNAGGTVFVQDPATAEFAAMPVAAISTGQADGVLPPEEIAREILNIYGSGTAAASPEDIISPEEFQSFYRVIQEKTGHRFEHYKKSVVGRRIRRRMFLRGISSFGDYIRFLNDRDAETASLASDLMIGVTSFFRDRLAWKALKIGVIKKLAAQDENSPVRVWCPACATGEEAYSIAMILQEEFDLPGRKRDIQVFATDVSDRSLEKAREGKYPGSVAADVPPEYMRKFFACSDDGLSVIIGKETRERVIFAKHDLLTDPPFSKLDLVICRNLLIYLEPPAQEKCLALFHYALKGGGYLFLGNAESVGKNKGLFRSLSHQKCRIYQKTDTGPTSRLSLTVPFASERASAVPTRQVPIPEQIMSSIEIVQETLLGEFAPAAVAIDQGYDILYHNGPTNRYLRQPRGAPTQNLLELLPEGLRNRVRGAIYRSNQEAKPVSIRTSISGEDEKKRTVSLRISKMRENLFLVVFREKGGIPEQAEAVTPEVACVDETAVRQLEGELAATRAELQSNIEQLKGVNEELQSSNEELQAANEELETSREELQSLNEELITVNAQLQSKVEEQEETNNDLNNFLASTNIPTIFLDHQFRVKRFTPAMSRLIKLIPSDVGRPLMDMSQEYLGPDLIADAESVLDHLVPIKKEFMINSAWYVRATLPYRTTDNRIEGVVITYSDITEIKKSEEIRGRLAAIVESADDAIIGKDLDGIIQTWNVGAEHIFGYKAEEVIGKPVSLLVPPGHTDEVPEILARIKEGEHIENFETVRMRKDGTIVPVSLTFSAIKDASGKVIGASKIAHDITQRKGAEAALRQSEEQFRALADSIPNLAWWANGDGFITWYNQRWYDYTGTTPEQMEGWGWQSVHDPEMLPKVLERWKASIATGEPFDMEFPLRGADGIFRPFLTRVLPLKDSAGRVFRWFGTNTDITEIKRAEEEAQRLLNVVQEEKDRLSALVNSISDEIWFADSQKRFTLANPSALQAFGFDSTDGIDVEKLAGSLEVYRLDGSPRPVEEAPPLRALKGEVVTNQEEIIRTPATGELRYRQVSASPVRDAGGNIIGSVSVVRDITERKRAENVMQARLRLATAAYSGDISADEVLRLTLDEIEAQTGSVIGFYHFLEADQETLSLQSWSTNTVKTMCTAEGKGSHYNISQAGVWVDCVRERRPVIHNDYASLSHRKGMPDGHAKITREMVIPIMRGKRIVAIIGVGNKPTDYHETDIEIASLLGDFSWEIVERKRTEDALKESESRYHSLFQNMTEGFAYCKMVYDSGGHPVDFIYIDVNEAFEKITGLENVVGKKVTEVIPGIRESNPELFDVYSRVALTGQPERFEIDFKPLEMWLSVSVYSTEMEHFVAVFDNITERKRAEQALKESEERVRRKLDSILSPEGGVEHLELSDIFDARAIQSLMEDFYELAHIPMAIIDLKGKVLVGVGWQEICLKFHRVHPETCKHCIESDTQLSASVPPGEFKLYRCKNNMWDVATPIMVGGQHVGNFFTGQFFFEDEPTDREFFRMQARRYGFDEEEYLAALEKVPRLSRESLDTAVAYYMKFSEMLSKLSFSNLKLAASLAEQKQAEADVLKLSEDMAARNVELEAVNKELESFIYSISHDLRAPLRSIAGFVNILVEDYAKRLDVQGQDYLARIHNGAEKMSRLIEDLLYLSKISRQEIRRNKVDMSKMASTIVWDLREANPERSVDVRILEGLTASADDRLIEIVLSNVLGNAWKFTSKTEKALIEFGSVEQDGKTVYYVRDNGAGFDPKYGEKMFWPFHRLHSDKEFPGTGIGLTIVERIIHSHGGRVWAEGQTGKGATIYFTLG